MLPRWHVSQVTSRSPEKLFWLMANTMRIISRAVFLFFLSSLSISRSTWQNSHSTPSDALMNCMVGTSWSAGMLLSTWMFLNSSAAVFAGALPAAPRIAASPASKAKSSANADPAAANKWLVIQASLQKKHLIGRHFLPIYGISSKRPPFERSVRHRLARSHNSDIVVGKRVMHIGQFALGHVTAHTIVVSLRTGFPRVVLAWNRSACGHVAAQAFLVVVRRVAHQRLVWFVAANTLDARITLRPAQAVL